MIHTKRQFVPNFKKRQFVSSGNSPHFKKATNGNEISKIFQFLGFQWNIFQIFDILRGLDRVLKTFNIGRICCPVVYCEEINAVSEQKMPQIDSKKDKKFPIFNVFLQYLSVFEQLH